MKNSPIQNKIIQMIKEKSSTLLQVIDNTSFSFNELKEVLKEIVEHLRKMSPLYEDFQKKQKK